MITVAEARKRLSLQNSVRPIEYVDLGQALGRVAAADVISSLDIPPNDNSAMDGFAFNSADLNSSERTKQSEFQRTYSISQRIPAGSQPLPLLAGTSARIFTGGMLPEGADCVVIQENCNYDDESVTVLKAVNQFANIRPKGQDISKGAVVVAQGQKLSAIDLSLLASIGVSSVEVFKPLTVALFSTGDELVEPGTKLQAGQIYNSNRPLLSALCQQLGFHVYDCGIVEDTLEATKKALSRAAREADVIISSGGVSVGEEDHIKPALEALGDLSMWKVQMKPGKPVAYGHIAEVPFLGLPGNPVSSFIVFQLLGIPLLNSLQGEQYREPHCFSVESNFDKTVTQREEYIRVKLVRKPNGVLVADRFANLSSGVMSSLSWADGLVKQSIDCSIEKGEAVEFLPLREAML